MLLTLTIFHTFLSIFALCLGIVALNALFDEDVSDNWLKFFLGMSVAVTVTGFFFPFNGPTPAFITGIVSVVVLILAYTGQYKKYEGNWRGIYAASVVISEFLLVFVTIAQGFDKIPLLHALAPTGTESSFVMAEIANLTAFLYITSEAVKKFKQDPDSYASGPYF